MNYVIAQGAPNSLIRKFQDNPMLGVELLEALKEAKQAIESYREYASSMSKQLGRGYFPMTGRGFSPEYLVAFIQKAISKAEGKL